MKLLIVFTPEEAERMLAGGAVGSSCRKCGSQQTFGITRPDESGQAAVGRVAWVEVTGGTIREGPKCDCDMKFGIHADDCAVNGHEA